jgi:plastocyanin
VARISGSWRFRYDYSKLQRLERNREQAMRWIALLVGVACISAAQVGIAQERVAGRVTLLEKGGKSTPDLGAAVVYLEGGTAGGAARPVTVDIAMNDKEFVPRVVVVPVGSTVRFPNHDPFDHNVFSAADLNPFDLGQYGRGEAKTWTFTSPGLVRIFCNVHPRMVAFVQVMAGRYFTRSSADGSFEIAAVPPGTWVVHAWHERSPPVARTVNVTRAGASGIQLQLDARGFRWTPHKNKYGKDYPTNAGRERY